MHEHGRAGRAEHGVGPVAPADDDPALIRRTDVPSRSRKVWSWPVAACAPVRAPAAQRADGRPGDARRPGTARAAWRRGPGRSSLATSNRDVPGTRLVIISSGSALLATTSGRNGTFGSRASAVRTPISRASRSAAGRDQANFTKNRSPAWTRSPSGTAGPACRPGNRDRIPAQLRCHGPQCLTQRRNRALSQPFHLRYPIRAARLPLPHGTGSGRYRHRDVRAGRRPRPRGNAPTYRTVGFAHHPARRP